MIVIMRKSICIYFCIILFSLVSCKSNIEKQNNLPVPVIFDTDVGNDIDDVLALQMLLNYESVGLVKILGLTVSKSNLLAPIYDDIIALITKMTFQSDMFMKVPIKTLADI